MKLKINIAKKHLYYLIGFTVFVFITAIAIAQSSAPNPGHAADEIGEGTIADTLTITNGNVGIGTTSPAEKLHVIGGNLAIGETSGGTTRALKFFDGTTTAFSAIINPSSAGLRFLTNNGNTDAMSILSTGNVGIGTTNPRGKLQIGNLHDTLGLPTYAGDFILDGSPSGSNAVGGIEFRSSVSAGGAGWKITATGNYLGHKLLFAPRSAGATWEAEVLTLTQNGNVGIGITSPTNPLHVVGGDESVLRVEKTPSGTPAVIVSGGYIIMDGGAYGIRGAAGQGMYLGANNVDVIYINTQSNVGIGTTNPGATLDVNGNIKTSSLAGSGNAYACVNANGQLYRSATACS